MKETETHWGGRVQSTAERDLWRQGLVLEEGEAAKEKNYHLRRERICWGHSVMFDSFLTRAL